MEYLENATTAVSQADGFMFDDVKLYGKQDVTDFMHQTGTEEAWGYKFSVDESEYGEITDTVTRFTVVVDTAVTISGRIKPTVGCTVYTDDDQQEVEYEYRGADVIAEINDVITGKYTCSVIK